MSLIIAPSILAADFANLKTEVESVLNSGADWIHVDVMDGKFVPNITMGPNVVKALRKHFDCFLDVHLMIEKPERYIDDFAKAGANMITVHSESTPHAHRALQQIKTLGIQAGIAYNPGTACSELEYLLDTVDMVLLMTVNPGFGGQSYIQSVTSKVEKVRNLLNKSGRDTVHVEVDGGITEQTIGWAAGAGADVFVAGSAVFSKENRKEAISRLRQGAPTHP